MSEEVLRPGASVIVTFALPDESRSFAASLSGAKILHQGRPPALPTIVGGADGLPVAIVHTGVGETAEGRERLQTMLAGGEIMAVISAGYAGGLAPGLRVGDLVLGENFSDPRLAESARALLTGGPLHTGHLVSRDTLAETSAAKADLAAESGALAVDMETAWISKDCAAAGAPMLSLRVISDAAGQDFPVPGHILFDAVRQRPRYVALPAWLLAHPGSIAPFVGFVRGLGPARARLTRALQLLLAHW